MKLTCNFFNQIQNVDKIVPIQLSKSFKIPNQAKSEKHRCKGYHTEQWKATNRTQTVSKAIAKILLTKITGRH